jgi:hypothetical protein
MSRKSPMNEILPCLLGIRAELESEREKIDSSLADLDRVIALMHSRISANNSEKQSGQGVLHSWSVTKTEAKSVPTGDRYQEMAFDALTEAGPGGLAPQKLRDDLGLDQLRFKVLVSKLIAGGEVSRVGGRGRGVRYVLSKLMVKSATNGAAHHPSDTREMKQM